MSIKIHIEGRNDLWDENKEEFYQIPGCDIELEHSLVSISKWEAKYHKSFINTDNKTQEETLDYIRMMIVDDTDVDPNSLYLLKREQMDQIGKYINDPMTATVISEDEEKDLTDKQKRSKFTTSEEIYSWMCLQNIPAEYEKWHLNRLIILIKLCAIANKPKDNKKKKMTSSDLALRRAKMEAARAKYSKH